LACCEGLERKAGIVVVERSDDVGGGEGGWQRGGYVVVVFCEGHGGNVLGCGVVVRFGVRRDGAVENGTGRDAMAGFVTSICRWGVGK